MPACQPMAGICLISGGDEYMSKRFPWLLVSIIVLIIITIWIVWPTNQGVQLGGRKIIQTKLGLDLVGGVQALLEADLPSGTSVDPEALSTARTIVENRVNGLGVNEAVVQQAGGNRILVELPGETDPAKALAALQQTGLLEFVDFTKLTAQEIAALQLPNTVIKTDFVGGGSTSTSPSPTTSATSPITSTAVTTPTGVTTPGQIFHTVMTGAELSSVAVQTTATGGYEVAFVLKPDGAQTFKDFTTNNVGKTLAIVLDKKVISAPNIQNPITEGKGVITGNYTIDSANALAIQLKYGSLPIPLRVASSQTVGPTLGQDSLQRSLIAGLIGMLVVMLYMALYYRLPGIVADLALIVYALITFSIFKLIPVTLTLPGIAGFVLSVGVAVDANVLIFERMKEELRAGRTLRQAVDLGWARAWPSIRDSNFSTLITCLILGYFGKTYGASIVLGFALTLGIGVLVSMFTAIIVTRTFLHLVLDNIEFSEHHTWFGVARSL
jgi:preprotein translocase subunit SecD